MQIYADRMKQSAAFLKHWNANHPTPSVGIVLGSGLAGTFPTLENQRQIAFSEIPGFFTSSVPGHVSELMVGDLTFENKTTTVAVLRGRTHLYEGHGPGEVVHNIRSLIGWGVKGIVLTNASGCLNANWDVGRLMLINDHINVTGMSPLFGEAGAGLGNRFVDLSNTWDEGWRKQATRVASEMNIPMYEGIYYGVCGPHYETPAEIRMMKQLGADAVGMSTVLEAIAARHLGAKVLGLACLTNYGCGLKNAVLEHSHVIEVGKKNAESTAKLLLKLLPQLSF